MKYIYKPSGTVVESDKELDSILFAPYEEKPQKQTKKKTVKKG